MPLRTQRRPWGDIFGHPTLKPRKRDLNAVYGEAADRALPRIRAAAHTRMILRQVASTSLSDLSDVCRRIYGNQKCLPQPRRVPQPPLYTPEGSLSEVEMTQSQIADLSSAEIPNSSHLYAIQIAGNSVDSHLYAVHPAGNPVDSRLGAGVTRFIQKTDIRRAA